MSGSLSAETLVALIQEGGPFSKTLGAYEERVQQQEMLQQVFHAYEAKKVSLIEAGTGTGKSLAYLIPALYWSMIKGERSLISTNTIALQEQLLNKDIPLIIKTLGLDLKVVLVKGMGNYLCIRRLEESRQQLLLFQDDEQNTLEDIATWAETTVEGSISDIPFEPGYKLWSQVQADPEACHHRRCPHFEKCHFFRARQEAKDAHLLIANHHLLFTDLERRRKTENYDDHAVLPIYKQVILDEAHNIEETALEHFAMKGSRWQLIRLLGRLSSGKGDESKLFFLQKAILQVFKDTRDEKVKSVVDRIEIDLSSQRHRLMTQVQEVYDAFTTFAEQIIGQKRRESKLRLLPAHFELPYFTEDILPRVKLLNEIMTQYLLSLNSLVADVRNLNHHLIRERTEGHLLDLSSIIKRLGDEMQVLASFVDPKEVDWADSVRWFDIREHKGLLSVSIVVAFLDISTRLREGLFENFSSVVLCSATLSTNKNFSFIRQRLGIGAEEFTAKAVSEHIYASPFDFQKQAMLLVPSDLPSPSAPSFTADSADLICRLIDACRGNAFVLFTSYHMLNESYQRVTEKLGKRYTFMKQGDDSRQGLLARFKKTDYSVLFGTDSFWEGVDVVGEALRCVIIAKLPFKVPTEPLQQAQSELLVKAGKDPFMDYSLPNSIMKFKQGFGRLIRNQKDRGCIICLDHRLIFKKYGAQFLNSLPNCNKGFATSDQVCQEMQSFYKRTYHLTKEKIGV